MSKPSKMVQRWFKFAQEDLISARGLLEMKNKNTWRASTFHSQQAVEKSIKGYLSFKKISFSKVHEVNLLTAEIEKLHPELKDLLGKARDLTPYAVHFRYPDSAPRELEESEVIEALDIAQQVVTKLSELIPFGSLFDV